MSEVLKVVGIERVDYQSKRTGNQVTGVKVYYTEERQNVEGLAVGEAYMNNMIDCSKLKVGSEIRLYYNRFRQVSMIDIVK